MTGPLDGIGRPLDPEKWVEVDRVEGIGARHIAAVRANAMWLEDRDRLYQTFAQPDGSFVIARETKITIRDAEGNPIGDDIWGLYDVPEDDDPAYAAFMAEMERMCGRSITLGIEDGASCELDSGHKGPHRGRSPFGDDFVEWTGGGMCAGDPLPVRDLRFTS